MATAEFSKFAELVTHYWLHINMDLLILSMHNKIIYFYEFNILSCVWNTIYLKLELSNIIHT